MALDTKKYTRSTETLFDILDAIADGMDAAVEHKKAKMDFHTNDKVLCWVWHTGDQNLISLHVNVATSSCIVVVSGDNASQWWTDITGPLDTAFGV